MYMSSVQMETGSGRGRASVPSGMRIILWETKSAATSMVSR